MELAVNFSRLESRKPLILGEAPVGVGLGAFPLYHKGKVPPSTQELLKLAFGDFALGRRVEKERLHSQLQEAFELDNLLSDVQPASGGRSMFDYDLAIQRLERDIAEAGMHEADSSLPVPKLYGRHVILLGRGGEALARFNATSPSSEDRYKAVREFQAERAKNFFVGQMVLGRHEGSDMLCVTNILSTFHPKNTQFEPGAKREAVRKLLQAGIRGTLFEYALG